MNKKIEEYLIEDIFKFKKEYSRCDDFEKLIYQKELDKYRGLFCDKKEFFKWKMMIIG